MNLTLAALWAALVCCIGLSAFFSASEMAFSASNRVRLKALAQGGERRADAVLALLEQDDRLLTAILIGNNVVNIAGTSIATLLFTKLAGESMGATLSTAVMTLLVLIVGEVSPKTLAKESPERTAMAVSGVIRVVVRLLGPVDLFFSAWRRMLSRVFKASSNELDIEDELMTMVDEAQSEGDMDAHEGELIRSAIGFDDQDALDIMTPRVDVTALEDDATMEEAAEVFRTTGYSRLPVYHEDMDHVVGILIEKDFYLAQHRACADLREIMTPAVYAPATLSVSKLLKLFQSNKTHMVVVLDEFGGTEGIVTLEDVLEELVGEIYDEHDDVSEEQVTLEDGSMQVDGGMPLTEFLESIGLEDAYASDTVGGWAAEVLGCIPKVGTTFETEQLRGQVTGMDRLRVTQVRIWKKDNETKD